MRTSSKIDSRIDQTFITKHPKVKQNGAKIPPEMHPESYQNDPTMHPKSYQNGAREVSGKGPKQAWRIDAVPGSQKSRFNIKNLILRDPGTAPILQACFGPLPDTSRASFWELFRRMLGPFW